LLWLGLGRCSNLGGRNIHTGIAFEGVPLLPLSGLRVVFDRHGGLDSVRGRTRGGCSRAPVAARFLKHPAAAVAGSS
jgi:hypothetical protein